MATKKRKRFNSAKKARKDEDRRRRLQGVTHLTASALALQNRFKKQSRRWLRHQLTKPGRGGIPFKIEQEIYSHLRTSKTDKLTAESRLALARLETERAGAREAAAVEGLGWVEDWFGEEGGTVDLEMEAEGDEGEQSTGEAEDSECEQDGRGRVILSPVPGAGAESGELSCGERKTGEAESMELPFRGFVSSAGTW